MFGEAGPPTDPDKIHVAWVIDTPHGVATIYDYGDCHDCPAVCDRDPRVFTRWCGEIDASEPDIEWHIGGNDAAARWVAEQLGAEFRP